MPDSDRQAVPRCACDEPLRFCSFRQMRVDLGQIRLEARTQRNQRDELEIEQQLINDADEPVRFRCSALCLQSPPPQGLGAPGGALVE